MDEANELMQLDWKMVFIGIVAIAAFIKVAIEFVSWIVKQFGIEFKHDRLNREEHEKLTKSIERISKLENDQKKLASDSKKYDNEIRNSVAKLSDAIQVLTDKVNDMSDKQDAAQRADLKDRIAQRYQKYTVEKKWTKMERESFAGLIKDYEAHGGRNSFVHEICEPESFTWVVTDEV